MSFLAIPMPFSRNTSPVVDASTSTPECSTNDPNCDLMRYLVALVVFVGLIALFMFGCKAVMRLFTRKRCVHFSLSVYSKSSLMTSD
ncbi:hypothetical protein B9Z55_010885 [Caenorhabditis nigoni]|uniref:Uncharacterized protein n=1 Tax=Caenorhabditis nigoni TaxID=1611254 RepID=A0A2G5UHQ4_9PELO|nr:hypothetical protein B9Z55_010885 [Caenorhabditis nigoni]